MPTTASSGWTWAPPVTAGHGWSLNGDADRVDLVTVAAHEVGYLLGLGHDGGDGMSDTLGLGERHLPTPGGDLVIYSAGLIFSDSGRP